MDKKRPVELIDRNLLISKLMAIEVDATSGLGFPNLRISREVERFIRDEVVQIVREIPYYTV